jgi:hypothetical protein
VLCGDTVVDADNCSLEQATEVFHTHCMDVSIDEGLGMADGFKRASVRSLLLVFLTTRGG